MQSSICFFLTSVDLTQSQIDLLQEVIRKTEIDCKIDLENLDSSFQFNNSKDKSVPQILKNLKTQMMIQER